METIITSLLAGGLLVLIAIMSALLIQTYLHNKYTNEFQKKKDLANLQEQLQRIERNK